jgi:hypothetical protein
MVLRSNEVLIKLVMRTIPTKTISIPILSLQVFVGVMSMIGYIWLRADHVSPSLLALFMCGGDCSIY